MYNRLILMGRLVKDPELRTTQTGVQMCRFSIAVDRYNKSGEEKQADFFDITAWRQAAEFVCKYFSKGRMIHIEGKLQNNNYTDQNGVKHYSNAIIADSVDFCGDKAAQPAQGNYNAPGNVQPQVQQYQQRPAQPAAPQYQQLTQYAQPAQAQPQYQQPDVGFGDFEEILSDGEPPF